MDYKGIQELEGQPDTLVDMETLAFRAFRVYRVILVYRVYKVTPVLQAWLVILVLRV